ncbi:MAG: hypothetical protein ACE5JX_11070 [Acidobacteriota bacterium]
MNSILKLTLFEEFELGVEILEIHQRRLAIPAQIIRPVGADQSLGAQMRISCHLIRDLLGFCGQFENLHKQELQDLEADLRSAEGEGQKVRYRHQRCAALLQEIDLFRRGLKKAEELARSLLRLPKLSRDEFDSFGYFAWGPVESFRYSDAFGRLRGFSPHWRRLHPLQGLIHSTADDSETRSRLSGAVEQLLYLWCLMRHIDSVRSKRFDQDRLILLMVHSYYRCRRLFVDLDDLSRFLEWTNPSLSRFFSATSAALKMEAGAALKSEIRHLNEKTDVNDRLVRGVGILQNAMEQGTRRLLENLEPGFDSNNLFDETERRFQQATVLIDDLRRLQQLAQRMESSDSEGIRTALQEELQLFKEQSFSALFVKDREVFKQFERELREADSRSRAFVLHRFHVYLSTLLVLVKNRSVLVNFKPRNRVRPAIQR